MTKLVLALVMLMTLAWPVSAGETCFFDRDRESGSNKICYYKCIGGEAAITVKAYQLCPLSIRR